MSTLAAGSVVAALVADRLLPRGDPLDTLAARVGSAPSVVVSVPLLFALLAGAFVAAGLLAHPYVGGGLAALALLGAARFWPAVRAASEDLTDHPARGIERLVAAYVQRLVLPLVAFVPLAWVSLPLASGAVVGLAAFLALAGPAFAPTVRVVAFLPTRLAAVLLAVAARDPDAPLRARRWVPSIPSPLGGWPTATMAAALGVRLETDEYVVNEVGIPPSEQQCQYARRVVGRAAFLAALLFGLLAWL